MSPQKKWGLWGLGEVYFHFNIPLQSTVDCSCWGQVCPCQVSSILWIKSNGLHLTTSPAMWLLLGLPICQPWEATLHAAGVLSSHQIRREPRSLEPGPARRPIIFTLRLCQLLAALQSCYNTARWCLMEAENTSRKAWAQVSGEKRSHKMPWLWHGKPPGVDQLVFKLLFLLFIYFCHFKAAVGHHSGLKWLMSLV